MTNIVNFEEFKEKKRQKDLELLAFQIKSIVASLRQDALNNIDKVLMDLGERHKDLFRICNYKYDSKYPFSHGWQSGEISTHSGIQTINIPKQTYDEYEFLKKLANEIAEKYQF